MLCAGAGASSGAVAGPRSAGHASVSAALDDASEGEKLNLSQNNDSDMVVAPAADIMLALPH